MRNDDWTKIQITNVGKGIIGFNVIDGHHVQAMEKQENSTLDFGQIHFVNETQSKYFKTKNLESSQRY